MTVNKSLWIYQHPLPRPDELFAALIGGVKFLKINLTQAYQQMILDKDSRVYVTINTHPGLFRYTRLPFGIALAPAIFQHAMDTILQGLPHVQCYIDDIIITGSSEEEHLHNLEEVLKHLSHYGIRVKEDKCAYFKDKVEYLDHEISSEGLLHTAPKKVEAIQAVPTPSNVQELRSFLGLLHYYRKFIPDLASLVYPMNKLLQAKSTLNWTDECDKAFALAKEKLTSATILAHYNPKYPLRLATDASSYGLGAVISHIFPNGVERPIAYASRTLTASERHCSQLEKEALSLVFRVQNFISSYMDVTLHYVPIMVQRSGYPLLQLPDYRGGLYNQLHIITQSSFVLLRLMLMQTHRHAYHLKVFTAKKPRLIFLV